MRILTRKTLAKKSNRDGHGGFGAPSKMPGLAYGISAFECKTGGALAKVSGSTCEHCYARKGRYTAKGKDGAPGTVEVAHARRLSKLDDLVRWQVAMIRDLQAFAPQTADEDRYFRFHDSGDLQSKAHLRAIMFVARACPTWRFWLPTREYGMVADVLRRDDCPENLVIRVSAAFVGKDGPRWAAHTSTVVHSKTDANCPAYSQGNTCADCRACWDSNVANVAYPIH